MNELLAVVISKTEIYGQDIHSSTKKLYILTNNCKLKLLHFH